MHDEPLTTDRRVWIAYVPVARSKALTRAIVLTVPALLLSAAATIIYQGLHFVPTGASNRLVDYSIALIALPVPLAGIISAVGAARWLLLAGWPGRVGVFADGQGLLLRLGPFGTRRYDAARLNVRYLFELSTDPEDEGFEAFLPEEEQVARFLPRVEHPNAAQRLNEVILRFAGGDEAAVAAALRPAVERWRSVRGLNRDRV